GMMLAAFAEAARYFNRNDYRNAAIDNARFLWERMRTADGRLYRSWRKGEAKLNGYLEDYACVAKGLQDNAPPSGKATAAIVLLKLAAPTGEGRYADLVEAMLKQIQPILAP